MVPCLVRHKHIRIYADHFITQTHTHAHTHTHTHRHRHRHSCMAAKIWDSTDILLLLGQANTLVSKMPQRKGFGCFNRAKEK